MKAVRNIFLILLAFFFLVVVTGLILARLFEQEVTSFIIKEVNKNLRAEINVGEVRLSLLKRFPDASVIFSDVFVRSVNPGDDPAMPDTLLSADRITLQFNLPDLVRNKYSLSDFRVSGGTINIYVSENGNGNYQFWNENREADTSVFTIDLNMVEFTDVGLVLDNRATQTYVDLYSRKAGMSGSFERAGFKLEARISGTIRNYSRNGIRYIRDKILKLEAKAERNREVYVFSSRKLMVGNIDLVTEGKVSFSQEADIDMKIRGTRIPIPSVMEYFPQLAGEIPRGIKYDGQSDVLLNITGRLGKTSMPHLEASYRIEKGSVQFEKTQDRISGIILRGTYSNGRSNRGETSVLQIEELSATYNQSTITGTMRLADFTDPNLECKLKSNIDLGDAARFISGDRLELSGKAAADLTVSAEDLREFGFTRKDFGNLSYKGSIRFENVSLMKGNQRTVDKVTANIDVDRYLNIKEISGVVCNNTVSIKGRIDNWTDYLIEGKGSLWADLSMYGGDFRMDTLIYCLGIMEDEQESSGEKGQDGNFVLKLRFWFDHFGYGKLEAENLRGALNYQSGMLNIRRAEGNTMGGYASAGASIQISEDQSMNIRTRMEFSGIDIREMFRTFDNFSQEFIQERHLKGKASGNIDFYGEFDRDLHIDYNTLLADAELTIEDGELIDFEPMEDLSSFIDMDELRHIRFSRLQNEIFIRDGKVIIPQMNISSSALNLSLSGDHAFNNYYNYKIKLSLSELLANKFRTGKKKEDEIGYIEEEPQGRTNIYLSVTGTPDDIKVSYDRKAALGSLRRKMTDEKISLKRLMTEEFRGNEDSLKGSDTTGDNGPGFSIDWNDRGKPAGEGDTIKNWKKESFILEFEEDTIVKGGKRK